MLRDGASVDLEDLKAGLLIGEGDFNLPVQAARTQQGRVQGVWAVCGHDDFHLQATYYVV